MAEKELLFSVTKKDFRIDTFRAGGKGGQKQNKTSSGVRFTHIESGAVGESREERSQHQNKKIAFKRCVESDVFKSWQRRKVAEIIGKKAEIERKVDRQMSEGNIRVETFNEAKQRWETADDVSING